MVEAMEIDLQVIFARNWQMVLFWYSVWVVTWQSVNTVFWKLFFPQVIRDLEKTSSIDRRGGKRTKEATERELKANLANLAINTTSVIHAIIVSLGCAYALIFPDPVFNEPHGGWLNSTPHSNRMISIACGYFLWDMTVVLLDFSWPFFSHAAACLYVYGFALIPCVQYYGMLFLAFELSTPFLHARWLLIKTGKGNTSLFTKVQNMFALTFFLVRICIGYPASFVWWQSAFGVLADNVVPSPIVYIYLLCNTVLCGLNAFWFYGMVRIAFMSK